MNYKLIGGAGFIGTNLAIKLAKNKNNNITIFDEKDEYFKPFFIEKYSNVHFFKIDFKDSNIYNDVIEEDDVVFHLYSSLTPTTSNLDINDELTNDIKITINLLNACIKAGVYKVIFFSSGGAIYGKDAKCPICEDDQTCPITTYGIQKLSIEKLLYLYNYLYNLNYRIVRLSNPYGPYQVPNGKLGAITTFLNSAIHNEDIIVYGDGTVVRDFIYIDDAIDSIINILNYTGDYKIFNVGSGIGTSINDIISIIKQIVNKDVRVIYIDKREVDVPSNYLNTNRYRQIFGEINHISLYDGIKFTEQFLLKKSI